MRIRRIHFNRDITRDQRLQTDRQTGSFDRAGTGKPPQNRHDHFFFAAAPGQTAYFRLRSSGVFEGVLVLERPGCQPCGIACGRGQSGCHRKRRGTHAAVGIKQNNRVGTACTKDRQKILSRSSPALSPSTIEGECIQFSTCRRSRRNCPR